MNQTLPITAATVVAEVDRVNGLTLDSPLVKGIATAYAGALEPLAKRIAELETALQTAETALDLALDLLVDNDAFEAIPIAGALSAVKVALYGENQPQATE